MEDSFWGHLGCKLEHLDQDEVVLSLEIKKHHLNLIGIVHGGGQKGDFLLAMFILDRLFVI